MIWKETFLLMQNISRSIKNTACLQRKSPLWNFEYGWPFIFLDFKINCYGMTKCWGGKKIKVFRILKHLQTVNHSLLHLETLAMSDHSDDYFKLIMKDSLRQSILLWNWNWIQPVFGNKRYILIFSIHFLKFII